MTGKRIVRSYNLAPPNTDGRLVVVNEYEDGSSKAFASASLFKAKDFDAIVHDTFGAWVDRVVHGEMCHYADIAAPDGAGEGAS
jgi:hypothetical protein